MKILMVLYLLTGNGSWGVVRVPATLNPNESCHEVIERNLTFKEPNKILYAQRPVIAYYCTTVSGRYFVYHNNKF
jgi:hypothetical protein